MTADPGLAQWVRLVADCLARAGVRQAVLSPGSRSTPLAWALLEHPSLTCRTVLDERSAGFVAVGQAKMTGIPTVLLSTSGSAPANYLPSVVEASCSGTPLVVLTADRPWELNDCGAPQTTDQLRLFGVHARAYVELGLPEASDAAQRGLCRRVTQAVFGARWPRPGPVHLNARVRKPLEPVLTADTPAAGDPASARVFLPQRTPDAAAIEWLGHECRAARQGLILCGAALPWQAMDPVALRRLAQATGFVLVPETTSQLRFGWGPNPSPPLCDGFEPLFRSPNFRRAFRPDCVLEFGSPLLSAGWDAFVRESNPLRRHAIAATGWPDPQNTLTTLTIADPTPVAEAVAAWLEAAPPAPATGAWRQRLERANRLVWEVVGRSQPAWGESVAVRTALEAMPAGSVLAVGSSLPLREVDWCVPSLAAEIRVWSQRGTNGIDGLLSGAVGATLGSAAPTALLVGDLGFLHDVGGLWAARELELPLALVVLNNGGGRIFDQLPVARAPSVAPHFDRHWRLSHDLDLAEIARAFGLRARRIREAAELRSELRAALLRPGCTVLEVLLPPDSSRDFLDAVVTQVDQALARSELSPPPG